MKAGYTEKTIGKTKIALKFGTNAFSDFCDMHGVELHEIDDIMSKVAGVRDLIYCAAVAASRSASKELKYNKYQIGDWLDEMDQSDYEDILKALNSSKIMGQGVKASESKK